ncbi:MAG: hypothetical protein PUK02_09920 [Parabacteroides sp.]|uniref:Secreted protein n=1 Tax=Parabacteroides faecalis TaxID=2924040 RepID=A0ABT0C0K7_9BACT|nr:hypothetical protein [Parabacteroides faecalis]MBS7341751.1 hypothetical protein [Parabacteroides sp.]MDY5623281.1 hypothetical protein [Bacteroidales bacterium]CDE62271.1 putative uncharacterized protein [Parabacteroides sp. CAG:409]HIX21391.1 hypothetical protein [Candidatus Parabacteroides faecavium]MCI7286520.1 hypothetical protein [Parabacteroides sp.]
MNERNLSKKWLYGFIVIAIAALGVLGWAFVKQDVTVMVATGLVVGVQVMNIIQWVQNHSRKK